MKMSAEGVRGPPQTVNHSGKRMEGDYISC